MYATIIKGEGNKGPTMYGARSLSPSPGDTASDGAEENFLLFSSSCSFGKIMSVDALCPTTVRVWLDLMKFFQPMSDDRLLFAALY